MFSVSMKLMEILHFFQKKIKFYELELVFIKTDIINYLESILVKSGLIKFYELEPIFTKIGSINYLEPILLKLVLIKFY
jgi:hypothetical protein